MSQARVGAVVLALLFGAGVSAATDAQQKPTAGASPMRALLQEGRTISDVEAARLEAKLVKEPGDIDVRARLLGYYFVPRSGVRDQVARRRAHILWLIQNEPASELAGTSEATLDPSGHSLADKVGYEKARALWIGHARKTENPAALGNAAFFLKLHDKPLAEEFLRKAQRLEPQNPEWAGRLGYVFGLGILQLVEISDTGIPGAADSSASAAEYARHAAAEIDRSSDATVVGTAGEVLLMQGGMMEAMSAGRAMGGAQGPETRPKKASFSELAERALTRAVELQPSNVRWSQELSQVFQMRRLFASPAEKEALARKQLLSLERALNAGGEPAERMYPLVDAARAAFELGQKEKARRYADELLELARLHRQELQFEYGHAIHYGNLVLGRLALAEGDRMTAGKHLVESGKIDGCAHLSSFGPNMTLAEELIRAGEKKPVVEYLTLCKQFWKMDRGRLDSWIADIQAGRPPEFGANLSY
jgi:tetratricopeptide (TPR) repeat protein